MPKKPVLKDILKKNRHIKKSELRKYSNLREALQKQGFCPKGYQLLQPFERQYLEADKHKPDPRTINLSDMLD